MIRRCVVDVLLGIYIALLIVPAAIMTSGESVVGTQVAVVVGGGVGIAAVGALAARSVDNLIDRLCSVPISSVIILLPFAYLAYLVFATEPGSTAELAALIGVLGVVPGGVSLFVGDWLRVRWLCEQSTEIVTVTVGDPDGSEWKQLRFAAAAIAGIALAAAGGATLLTGEERFSTLAGSLGGLSALLLLAGDDSTELTVTDTGVQSYQSFVVWEDLDGYRLTDDSLVLVRSAWYLPDRQFDREAISDESALLNGVSTYLPRLNEEGERMDKKIESYC